jgi:alpha-glucosidase/alpha-D-xyloside xylohydrolase
MPYLYSVVREGCVTGLPIIRALWLHDPGDPAARSRGDEFLFGPDILVAPVTEKGATSRALYLPRGSWYDYWSEQRVEGGREIRRPVDLATIPLHVRAGAIIPFGPVKQYTGEEADSPLSLSVYSGANGHFLLYEDDGVSFNYRKGDWMGIELRWDDSARELTMQLAEGSNMRPPIERRIEVRLIPGKHTRKVVFVGKHIEIRW